MQDLTVEINGRSHRLRIGMGVLLFLGKMWGHATLSQTGAELDKVVASLRVTQDSVEAADMSYENLDILADMIHACIVLGGAEPELDYRKDYVLQEWLMTHPQDTIRIILLIIESFPKKDPMSLDPEVSGDEDSGVEKKK